MNKIPELMFNFIRQSKNILAREYFYRRENRRAAGGLGRVLNRD